MCIYNVLINHALFTVGDYNTEEVRAIAKVQLAIGKRELRMLGSYSMEKAYYSVKALGASIELLVWATDVKGGRNLLYTRGPITKTICRYM